MKHTNEPHSLPRGRLLWSGLFLLIAAATIWAVTSQSRSFSLSQFVEYLSHASAAWIAAAVLCMLGFILFEGEAIVTVCRAFGHPTGHKRGFIYSAADLYFSAITPSATGGQPACAWFMIKDGMPGMVTTVALLLNLTMYTASILILGLLALLICPSVFLNFGIPSKILIGIGAVIQTSLATFLLLLLRKRELLHKICRTALHILCKLHLLRQEEEKQRKLDASMAEYAEYAGMISGHGKAVVKVLVLHLLQRACFIAVPVFVFLASGGAVADAPAIWAMQCFCVIGSTFVPIPGAMGVTDYLMLDVYGSILQNAVQFELLSRALSFYLCIILCGVTVLIKLWTMKARQNQP